jgi:hypothetical protein
MKGEGFERNSKNDKTPKYLLSILNKPGFNSAIKVGKEGILIVCERMCGDFL